MTRFEHEVTTVDQGNFLNFVPSVKPAKPQHAAEGIYLKMADNVYAYRKEKYPLVTTESKINGYRCLNNGWCRIE